MITSRLSHLGNVVVSVFEKKEAMSNNTSCFTWGNLSMSRGFEYSCRGSNSSYGFIGTFESSIVIAVLSPVAVVGNALILTVIWKKTFQRTHFHLLLSRLAFTDLCTGLVVQPVNVATILLYTTNGRVPIERTALHLTLETIADGSATYFISVTILILTVMSVERWMHMSHRSLVATFRGCLTVTVFFVIPAPLVALRSLKTLNPGSVGRGLYILNMTIMLFCFLTMLDRKSVV